jgi:hypothetical protein
MLSLEMQQKLREGKDVTVLQNYLPKVPPKTFEEIIETPPMHGGGSSIGQAQRATMSEEERQRRCPELPNFSASTAPETIDLTINSPTKNPLKRSSSFIEEVTDSPRKAAKLSRDEYVQDLEVQIKELHEFIIKKGLMAGRCLLNP